MWIFFEGLLFAVLMNGEFRGNCVVLQHSECSRIGKVAWCATSVVFFRYQLSRVVAFYIVSIE